MHDVYSKIKKEWYQQQQWWWWWWCSFYRKNDAGTQMSRRGKYSFKTSKTTYV
jgi:hypothetical protein